VLLAGAAGDVCLHLDEPVSRAELRRLVAERHRALADAGLRRGGSVALCLAPSLAFIANLLASWQIGGQASLLDHRLTPYEVDVALQRLLPRVVVTAERSTGGPLRGFAEMYGMTEVGVIATDLFGVHRPAVRPAPGLTVREEAGELHVSLPVSPYLGDQDPNRWSDGWLHTKDAGSVDRQTGLVRVLGRRDSQVCVGGLKVDLTEVEHMLAALPEVAGAVVMHDHAIEAYLVLAEGAEASAVEREITTRLRRIQAPAAAARGRAATVHGHREACPRPRRSPRRRAGRVSDSSHPRSWCGRRPPGCRVEPPSPERKGRP
jgi:acyl-coenzyme A synthetase/AMP-(fatty) acid ligase